MNNRFSKVVKVATYTLLVLFVATLCDHESRADKKDSDFEELVLIQTGSKGTLFKEGRFFSLGYIKEVDGDDDDDGDGEKNQRDKMAKWQTFKVDIVGIENGAEKSFWRRIGKTYSKPPHSLWSIKNFQKGSLTQKEISRIENSLGTIIQAQGRQPLISSSVTVSTQGMGQVYVNDDGFRRVGNISNFPMTKEFVEKELGISGYNPTPAEEAYIQLKVIIDNSPKESTRRDSEKLALHLLDKTGVKIGFAEEITQQLSVKVKTRVVGTVTPQANSLIENIAAAFKGSTTDRKRVKVKLVGSTVETDTAGNFTPYENHLVDELAANIKTSPTISEISIDAKFKKKQDSGKTKAGKVKEGDEDD